MNKFKTKNGYTAYTTLMTIDLPDNASRYMLRQWWNGYIEIPKKYIDIFEKDKDKISDMFDVHGGVTFNDYETWTGNELYLVGFDCNHLDDLLDIKDENFVIEQLEYLSEQIDEYIERNKTKVYITFLRYVRDRTDVVQAIFKTEEQAKEYCKLPEGMKPSGLCYLYYEEYEVL